MSKRGMKWLVVFLVTVLVAVLSIHIYQYMKDRSSAANALGELFVIVDAINKGMVEYKDAYEGTQEAHKKRRIAKEGVDLGSKYSFARESFRKALSELDLMDAPNDKDLEAARKKLRLCATEMERSTDILANALMAYGTRDWKAAKGLNPQEAYAKKDNSVQYLVDALKSMGRVIVDSKLDDNVKRDYVKRYSYMFNVQPTEAIEYIYDLFDVNNAMSEKEDVVVHILTEPVQYDRVKIRS
jgi:hypothetical protein